MTRKRILVDMDDVLADLVSAWANELSRVIGIEISKHSFTEWNVQNALRKVGVNLSEENIFSVLGKENFYSQLLPIPNAIESVEYLMKSHDILIVTSLPTFSTNPGQIVNEKIEWLKRYLPEIVTERKIAFTYQKGSVDADLMIDDSPVFLSQWKRDKICFDQPWNRHLIDLPRATNWKTTIKLCEEILNG